MTPIYESPYKRFEMPCLPKYEFDITGRCWKNGVLVLERTRCVYHLLNSQGYHESVTRREIIQYGKHIQELKVMLEKALNIITN